MDQYAQTRQRCAPWNKGKLIGQKSPLKLNEIWAIRIRLHLARKTRDLALFNLGIDSKLRVQATPTGARCCSGRARGSRLTTPQKDAAGPAFSASPCPHRRSKLDR